MTSIPLVTSFPTPSRQRRKYFYVKDILIHPTPFHHLSHSNPLFFENVLLFALPFLCQGPSTLTLPPIGPKTPSPQTTRLLPRPRPLTPRSQHPLTAPFACSRTPSALPSLYTPQSPLSISNLFSALAARPEGTHHSGGCYCHCSGCYGPPGSARVRTARSSPWIPAPAAVLALRPRVARAGHCGTARRRPGPPAPLPSAPSGCCAAAGAARGRRTELRTVVRDGLFPTESSFS